MLIKYTDADLRAEIQTEIDALLAQRQPVHPAWVTHQLCKRHLSGLADPGAEASVESEHRAFWRHNGYTNTRKLATICINAMEEDRDERKPKPFLPGFALLRPQYVVRQNGVDVMVPTEQMTVTELYAKATQYDRNSGTLADHALELRRYAEMRSSRAAGQ